MRDFTDAELLQIIEDDESDRVEFKRRYGDRPFDLYPIPTSAFLI